MVVEGVNDIEFLRRISLMLNASDCSLPNLADLERQGVVVFIPFGGGKVGDWAKRLSPLRIAEFHIYDHELPPEAELRCKAANVVNQRPDCHATLTRKRSLENYLHPTAIEASLGLKVEFDDFDPVAEIVARKNCERSNPSTPWQLLTRRAQKRAANYAKRRLNTRAAEAMTSELLEQSDPVCEIASWLRSISSLIGGD